MARRRRPEAPEPTDDVPAWLWEFDGRDWGWHSKNPRAAARAGRSFDGHYAAKTRWFEACTAWLAERGLATDVHTNWRELQRREREDPGSVLRRPRPGGQP